MGLKYKEQVVLMPIYENLNNTALYNTVDFDNPNQDLSISLSGGAGVLCCYKQNGFWGVMDAYEILIEPTYDDAVIMATKYFSSDYKYVRVKLNNKYGVVTTEGQEVLPLNYDDIITVFYLWHHDIKKDRYYFITERNGVLSITTSSGYDLPIKVSLDDFKNKKSLKKLRKLINKEATKQIEETNLQKKNKEHKNNITYAGYGKNRVIITCEKDKSTIRLHGRTFIVPTCDSIISSDGFNYAYRIGDKYGLFNKNKIIVEPIYDKASPGDYWHIISKNGKYGLVNSDGKETIAPMYDNIFEADRIDGSWVGWIFAAMYNDIVNIVSPNNTILLSNIKWDKKRQSLRI